MSYWICIIDHVRGMKVKVPSLNALAGLAGSPPPPPSPPLHGAGVWGGGGLGGLGPACEFWVGKGGCSGKSIWRADMVSELGGGKLILIPRSKRVSGFGNLFWRFDLAVLFRGSIWQIYSAGRFGRFIQWGWMKGESKAKKSKVKHVLFCRPVISNHNDTVYN
jgi:hypothetical protein